MHRHHLRGLTLADVVTTIVLSVIALVGVAYVVGQGQRRRHLDAQLSNCKNHQRQLLLAATLHRDDHALPPPVDLDGSDFLIALYSDYASEPQLYLCPATHDECANGADLLPGRGRAPRNAVSYASRRELLTATRGEQVITADDDEGTGAERNHGDRVIVGFADGHIEERRRAPETDALLDPLSD